jgi:hypothetical protein
MRSASSYLPQWQQTSIVSNELLQIACIGIFDGTTSGFTTSTDVCRGRAGAQFYEGRGTAPLGAVKCDGTSACPGNRPRTAAL